MRATSREWHDVVDHRCEWCWHRQVATYWLEAELASPSVTLVDAARADVGHVRVALACAVTLLGYAAQAGGRAVACRSRVVLGHVPTSAAQARSSYEPPTCALAWWPGPDGLRSEQLAYVQHGQLVPAAPGVAAAQRAEPRAIPIGRLLQRRLAAPSAGHGALAVAVGLVLLVVVRGAEAPSAMRIRAAGNPAGTLRHVVPSREEWQKPRHLFEQVRGSRMSGLSDVRPARCRPRDSVRDSPCGHRCGRGPTPGRAGSGRRSEHSRLRTARPWDASVRAPARAPGHTRGLADFRAAARTRSRTQDSGARR